MKVIINNLELTILIILKSSDNYGNGISQIIKNEFKSFEIKEGTLYSNLKRMNTEKLIEGYWGEETGGGRRRYFKITISGQNRINELITEYNAFNAFIEKRLKDVEND